MKIYLEYIFIINFLLDFMILYGTKRILKKNTSNLKLIISSIIGSFSTFILLINISNLSLFIIKIILSIIMITISFGITNLKENILYFYFLSIIIGGLIYLFDLKTNEPIEYRVGVEKTIDGYSAEGNVIVPEGVKCIAEGAFLSIR